MNEDKISLKLKIKNNAESLVKLKAALQSKNINKKIDDFINSDNKIGHRKLSPNKFRKRKTLKFKEKLSNETEVVRTERK